MLKDKILHFANYDGLKRELAAVLDQAIFAESAGVATLSVITPKSREKMAEDLMTYLLRFEVRPIEIKYQEPLSIREAQKSLAAVKALCR